jgi:poly(3-hydroxybutyrate) depolymerase
VALLEVHGTEDPFLRWVPKLMRSWTRRNGCSAAAVRSRPARGVTRWRWPGCAVERVLLKGVPHLWPIGTPADYDATPELWRFWRRAMRG